MKPFNSLFPTLALSGALILPACSEKPVSTDTHVTTTQKKVETIIVHRGDELQKHVPIIIPELLAEKQTLLPAGVILTKDGEIFSGGSGSILKNIDIETFDKFANPINLGYFSDKNGVYYCENSHLEGEENYGQMGYICNKFNDILLKNLDEIFNIGGKSYADDSPQSHISFISKDTIYNYSGHQLAKLPKGTSTHVKMTSYGNLKLFVSSDGTVILGNGQLFSLKRKDIQIKIIDLGNAEDRHMGSLVIIKNKKSGKLYNADNGEPFILSKFLRELDKTEYRIIVNRGTMEKYLQSNKENILYI